MKKLFILILLIAGIRVPAADLYLELSALGVGAGNLSNRPVLVQPVWLNPTNTVGVSDAKIYRTSASGILTITNVPEAILNIEVMAPPARTQFSIYVEDTTNTLNVAYLRGLWTGGRLSPTTYALAVKSSDQRYARKEWQAVATTVDNATGTNVYLNGEFSGTFPEPILLPSYSAPYYSVVGLLGLYNGFYGNTNYPESMSLGTNNYAQIRHYINGENYLDATNSTGRTPKYEVVSVVIGGSTFFKLASDLTGQGNSFFWFGGDIVSTKDIRFDGIAYGNGHGLTNLEATNIVGAWSGIVTNWGTGMGGNSNRVYYSSGTVTNVTRP